MDQVLTELQRVSRRLRRDRERRDQLIREASENGTSRRQVAKAADLSVGAVQQILRRLGVVSLLALVLTAVALAPGLAKAEHSLGGRYWDEQPIKVVDFGAAHSKNRQHWRSTRDAALDEWEASGVVRFRIREARGPNCEADREGVAAAKLMTPADRIAICRMRSGNPLTGGYALISGPKNGAIREATVAVRSPNALCHEVGHAIGLGHPAVSSDHFMGSCLGWGGLHPGVHDLEMLRLIYGVTS